MMTQNVKKQVKAVGLMSGGLDSALAAKIVKDLGVEVHGIHFVMPWELPDHSCAMKVSAHLGIEYMALQFDRQYLDIVKNPQYGYGSAMNPCVDCHIH
ncbi:MAG TPA: 7-cyano-7-deazaguanine synthase, partial [Candidatus Omnitrophota bacterium]|nr:7-cyano-7-deazaguanine synthase [Candidatus Omnitrophota bacterium]